MAEEIERSYFVNPNQLPPLDGVPYIDIKQTYFTPWPPDNRYPELADGEWRVREKTDPSGRQTYSSTVKFGSKASGTRQECDPEIDADDFGANGPEIGLYGFGQVRKRRFKLPGGIELDRFEPNFHRQLWLAEKEFPTRAEMDAWQPPDWCGEPFPSNNRELARPLVNASNNLSFEAVCGKPWARISREVEQRYRSYGNLVVTVSGFSASGKTTLAKELAERLGASLISADNYHIGATALRHRFGQVNHDLPGAYDIDSAARDASKLLERKKVLVPNYDFVTAEPADLVTELEPGERNIVVIDGLYAYLAKDRLPSYNIFVNTPLFASVLRRMKRDTNSDKSADPNERKIAMSQEESLHYLMHTALPTYLENCEATDYRTNKSGFQSFDAFTSL